MTKQGPQILTAACLFLVCFFCVLAPAWGQQGVYPQLDISGYKKWEYKKADVNPSRNYFTGLTHLGGYYPTFTGGPWQERLQLRILGQLSDDLSVTYDLEQQPETPDRYDVKVKYLNSELTFGDFTATVSGNEFATASKFLNGVMLTSKNDWYDLLLVPSAKLKSQTQNLTSQNGNNTKGPYSLGHGSIVEGSERVELNGNLLRRNVDYTIDYFDGKINFSRILATTDLFKYSYEFTNVLDLFFPTLSKRDSLAFQARFSFDPETFGRPIPKKEPVIAAERETFPFSGTAESETRENEAAGLYQLQNVPVVRFSEKLVFMGTELKKNEDYIIRYNEGEIKLLTRFLPTVNEPLMVEYKYYQTTVEGEVINGIASRGPYRLKYGFVVPESERIEVDGKLFVRDLDYSINYKNGEVSFGIVIGPTSQIKARYLYNVLVYPATLPSEFPKELKVGTTYLRESAKAGSTTNTSTAIESFSGSTIITNNYHIYLTNRPLVSTGEALYIDVKLNGRSLTREADYVPPRMVLDPATGYYNPTPEATLAYLTDHTDPSDGYQTGTLKILNPALISSSSEVVVTYTYYKSVVSRYNGVGDGTRGPYYLRNIRNIAPGTETVQVWVQGSSTITTFTRNSSFEANAGDTGYTINYNADNPYILFNDEVESTKNFQIIYQYVPPTGSIVEQDISQALIGVDGSYKIGDVFKMDAAYARSETDRYIAKEPTTETFSGSGVKSYTLHAPGNIIENTEQIYLNGRMLNKDIDYYVSYTKPGQFSLYYVAPATQDAIRVDYYFQSTDSGDVNVQSKVGGAYHMAAEAKLLGNAILVNGCTKKIDYDFSPMGGIPIGIGSERQEYNLKLNPVFHAFTAAYSYKENADPVGARRNSFQRSYDNSLVAGISPMGMCAIDLTYRNYRTIDDPLSPISPHNSDQAQNSYTLNLSPSVWTRGPVTFNQKYELKKTNSQQDTERDSNAYSETNIDYGRAGLGLSITERFSAGVDYQINESKTVALRSSSTEATSEATSSHTRFTDTGLNFQFDLTPKLWSKFLARVNLANHLEQTLAKNFSATNETVSTKNETYHLDFVPLSLLQAALDHNRQEKISFVLGGANPQTARTTANVNFVPVSWLTAGYNNTQSESVPETGAVNRTTGRVNAYSVNCLPIASPFCKLNLRFNLTDKVQTAPSGTTPEVETDTNSFSQDYALNLLPHPLLPIILGINIENYHNQNNHPLSASRINLQTENQTLTAGLTWSPDVKFSFRSDYNLKITKIVQDLSLTPQSRQKTLFDNNVSYKIADWGTVSYDRLDEINGGEIQAGAIADLNLQKVTETLSLNVNLPVNNPVLSSFVFVASIKSVDYKNLKNTSEDFKAALTTFEGTLNF